MFTVIIIITTTTTTTTTTTIILSDTNQYDNLMDLCQIVTFLYLGFSNSWGKDVILKANLLHQAASRGCIKKLW